MVLSMPLVPGPGNAEHFPLVFPTWGKLKGGKYLYQKIGLGKNFWPALDFFSLFALILGCPEALKIHFSVREVNHEKDNYASSAGDNADSGFHRSGSRS